MPPEENGPRDPFDSGIDDSFDRIEEERQREIEEDALKYARTRLQTDKQVEDAVARQFPPEHSSQAHNQRVKELLVHHTDLWMTNEPLIRKAVASSRRAFREIDALRMDQRGAYGGAIRAMKTLEASVKTQLQEALIAQKKELYKMGRDRTVPGLFFIIMGLCAIVIAGMYFKMDEKMIVGLAGAFVATTYELSRRLHDKKLKKEDEK